MDNNINPSENSQQKTRAEQIVEWLATQSELVGPISNSKGFFIRRGKIIKLKNGTEVEALEWLEKEGITGGKKIGGYQVKHLPPKDQFAECLMFFKEVLHAPF